MNHLKHIRGISVRASSNATLPMQYGQLADVYFENCQLKSQVLRSNPLSGNLVRCSRQFHQDSLRLVSKESKIICKQRSKTKSSVTSLKKKSSIHKKLPSENVTKRVCHSTCQNTKFNSNGINKPVPQSDVIINGVKNISRNSSFIASTEKHPRPYAEMIADYSESLYKESIVAARNDSFQLNNAIRKSPFSTSSVPPLAKTIVNVAEYSEFSTERQKNDFSLPIKPFDLCKQYNNMNTIKYNNFQHDMHTAEVTNICQSFVTNDLNSGDQSYIKLVADCSKSMHNISSVLNDLAPKKNELTRSSFESVTTSRKCNSTCTQNRLQEIPSIVNTLPFEKNKGQVIDLKESDWLKEMENVISDLKSVTERKVAKVIPKIKNNNILQPADASNNLLDNIHGFAELIKSNKQRKEDTTIRKLSYQSNKIDRMEKRKKDFELQKHNYSFLSDKTSNLPQYFSNTAESSPIRKNSTHVSTSNNTGVLKQPQVKLRMVPSEKESIVSINVDQASIGSSDPLNSISKHLSIVVQSDQKEDLTDNQWNASTLRRTAKNVLQRSDFGPMHISISENSAPVKQIEFSINGKPVSELKSITARTERLDVVSSVDKIEIRIPFAKDDHTLDKTREEDLSKGINTNTGQILNVQISANFQKESTNDTPIAETPAKTMRYQYGKNLTSKSLSSSISKTPSLSNNFPKVRQEILNNNNIQQYESSKRVDMKFNDEKNINEHKTSDNFEIQRKATKTDKTMPDVTLIKEVNDDKIGSLDMKKAITKFPEANKCNKNESFDNRVPSKIIPWWSSSDSFNKIRKKEDNNRPSSNRNKVVSNSNQNLTTETLLSKPKEISNSKILTKELNNVMTSDSNNIISYSNSIKPYEEFKPIPHYTCSFRLKSNQGNPSIIPEVVERNSLKVEDNQALIPDKDVNKISGVKQTKAKNQEEEKQEKKNNYSLKETRSINAASKNIKSKMKNILDVIKPIEKKEDDILIDYSLNREMLSRKPTVILNNSEVKNPSPVIKTKDLTSNLSAAEITSKKIDKTMLTKQMESTEEKLKTKMNILLKEKDLKNDTTIDIKALNKNDIKDIKEVHKNDFTSSYSSTFRNSPKLTQIFKKEQLTDDSAGFQDKSKQNFKSLLKADKNGPSPLLNTRISSGTVHTSKKLGFSGKVSLEESKQNRPKSLTSIKNTSKMSQESEKLKGLSPKLTNPFNESSDTIMINKPLLQTVKQIQSKSSKNVNKSANINKLSSSQTGSNSKPKDHGFKNLIDKNINETSITQYPKMKKTDMKDTIVKIVTQNPKNIDSLSKDEKNFNKSESNKGNLSGSADPSRKPNDSVGFKSAGSKTKPRVMSNNNCTYNKKLLMELFYSNFNRTNDIMSNLQSAILKVQQNLNDINMLEHPMPPVMRCDGSWINMDRPEKGMLYSAWLQRSDI